MSELAESGFRHEALLYAGWPDFVAGTVPFIREGLRSNEPLLVVLSPEKINLLQLALGDDGKRVLFADMQELGSNPARIIPIWQEFVDQHSDVERLRGIGEPIWKGRTPDELVECQRHEALLNTAFRTGRRWSLLCPYDVSQLPVDVIEEASRSHEFVTHADEIRASAEFSTDLTRLPLNAPLAEPPAVLWTAQFDRSRLGRLREQIGRDAESAGLSKARALELVIASNEVATNSILFGDGRGVARLWREPDRVVCEIRDRGRFDEPLAGRRRPLENTDSGRGLWLANQLCDLVQVRSRADGTTVRIHALVDSARRPRVVA